VVDPQRKVAQDGPDRGGDRHEFLLPKIVIGVDTQDHRHDGRSFPD
jgi:hypothetical protein